MKLICSLPNGKIIETIKLDEMKIRDKLMVPRIELEKFKSADPIPGDGYISIGKKFKRSELPRSFRSAFQKERLPRKLKKACGQISNFYRVKGKLFYKFHPCFRTRYQRHVMNMIRRLDGDWLIIPIKNGRTVTVHFNKPLKY